MRRTDRWRAALALALCAALLPACRQGSETVGDSKSNAAGPLKDEIPSDQLDAVLAANRRGVALMENYDKGYREAARAFGEVHERAPGLIAGSINLAIALLNDSGSKTEEAAGEVGAAEKSNFERAIELLDGVLERDPDNPYAHYNLGLIREVLGDMTAAHAHFQAVAEHDPLDGHAWWKAGSTLTLPGTGGKPGPEQADLLIAYFEKAVRANPYLVPAWYQLQQAYGWARKADQQREALALWQKLNPQSNAAAPSLAGDRAYGDVGKYGMAIPLGPRDDRPAATVRSPRFDAPKPLDVRLPDGHRWVREADFQGPLAVVGRARGRFGAAAASFDADGDGTLDLYLAAAVAGPDGVRDALLLNRGDGQFEDATEAWGVPTGRASLGVAAGDFDADRHVDLFLAGVGDNRLLRNVGSKFEDVSDSLGDAFPPALSVSTRWFDFDQDGDLDLYVVNYADAEHADAAFTDEPPPGVANAAYRNDGKPAKVGIRPADNWAPVAVATEELGATEGLSIALTPWDDEAARPLLGGEARHSGLAVLDVDGDRDLDVLLPADGAPTVAVVNDRLGRFHAQELEDLTLRTSASGMLVVDVDKDGRPDLAAVGPNAKLALWRNRTARAPGGAADFAFEFYPSDAHDLRSATVADLDLDGWHDLLGLPLADIADAPVWARNAGNGLNAVALALSPDDPAPLQGLALADLIGDPLPDLLLIRDGAGPRLARNLGNGHHWIALELDGRWARGPDMRTNPHGLGTSLSLTGQGFVVPYAHTTTESGPSQSVGPIVLGMGDEPAATALQLRWPDGVLQAELNLDADQVREIAEVNRKTSSCPVLFTYDGERFVCVADFLGGGGLGYLVAPGVYGDPDRDEAVAIEPEQLRAVGGALRLVVAEPMDEVSYLDRLTLDVVDRPPGVRTALDERFSPGGNRPTGALVAWREAIEPVRATDLQGRDVTETLRDFDRRTVDDFRRLGGWVGYADDHGIVLDFGDRLSSLAADTPLMLCLAGWVEYPYSQTNYAAATAGHALKPPVLERLRDDGSWEVIEPDPGYPAGMPRLTTLDLTGKLTGPRCLLRLSTNMECYYDQAFVAVRDPSAPLRVTSLDLARAELGYRGYIREVSPDGRRPLLYDYAHADPAPLARLSGRLTRYGDVVELLRDDDDRLCLVGPGDEARLEFDAGSLPPLPEGWTRAYVLRAVGYCKDADPFTASSDTVGPLPWRGMGPYPFGPGGERPADPAYEAYLRRYQTRDVLR